MKIYISILYILYVDKIYIYFCFLKCVTVNMKTKNENSIELLNEEIAGELQKSVGSYGKVSLPSFSSLLIISEGLKNAIYT